MILQDEENCSATMVVAEPMSHESDISDINQEPSSGLNGKKIVCVPHEVQFYHMFVYGNVGSFFVLSSRLYFAHSLLFFSNGQ